MDFISAEEAKKHLSEKIYYETSGITCFQGNTQINSLPGVLYMTEDHFLFINESEPEKSLAFEYPWIGIDGISQKHGNIQKPGVFCQIMMSTDSDEEYGEFQFSDEVPDMMDMDNDDENAETFTDEDDLSMFFFVPNDSDKTNEIFDKLLEMQGMHPDEMNEELGDELVCADTKDEDCDPELLDKMSMLFEQAENEYNSQHQE